jgi:hypothetical protein
MAGDAHGDIVLVTMGRRPTIHERAARRAESSPFALAEPPTTGALETEGEVRYVLVNGHQDDGVWGPVAAVWLSADAERGGVVVCPWALWTGAEIVRGHESALRRGWSSEQVYGYWRTEVWPGQIVDEERRAASLRLLWGLLSAL